MTSFFYPPERRAQIHRNASHYPPATPVLVDNDPQSLSDESELCELLAPQESTYPMKCRGANAILRIRSDACIGRGASATVYGAELEQGTLREWVAVKVHHVNDDILKRELRTWRALSHINVLPFYGTCRLGFNQLGLVAPRMKCNLMHYLERHPRASRSNLLRQAARGLHYLHVKAGVVHGDIKGENVLVSRSGTAMLADFGLSTTITPGEYPTATEICNKMTLQFAAPELIDETLVISPETPLRRSKTKYSDVYAFGVLIYQVYAGHTPWANMNTSQICVALAQGHMPGRFPACGEDEDTWLAIWEVCVSCLSHAPCARPRALRLVQQLRRTAAPPNIIGGAVRLPPTTQEEYEALKLEVKRLEAIARQKKLQVRARLHVFLA